MRKGLLIIALSLFASLSAYAGVFTGENEDFSWDFRVGCNFNSLYMVKDNGAKGKLGGNKAGLSLSTNVKFFFNEIVALETGLGVQQRGSKDWTMEGIYNGTRFNSWYGEIPLNVSLAVIRQDMVTGFLDAGFYGACGFAGKYTSRDESGPLFGSNGLFKRGDFGFGVGIAATISDLVYVGLRYQRSILSISNEWTAKEYGRIYNNGFSLRLGIML